MVNFPGWFAGVTLAKKAVGPPDGIGDLDVAGLNFALVLHEDAQPLPERFTTWGLQADSSLVYQTLSAPNALVIGDAGNLYVLEDDIHDDNGAPVECTLVSSPYPMPNPNDPMTGPKRIHEVTWQVRTALPIGGQSVTIGVYDVDNPDHFISKTILQVARKVRVQLSLTNVRQWRFRWNLVTKNEYDIMSIGYKYQVMKRPYAAQQ